MQTAFQDRVILHGNRISGVTSNDFPGATYGKDEAFDMQKFKEKMEVQIVKISPDLLEFDLVGVDASIANALRRIMISEVPTMAIKTAYILNNTTTIPDEMLAHRLGLLPIKADPAMFQYLSSDVTESIETALVFRLHATCKYNPNADDNSTLPTEKYIGAHVLACDFAWLPQPGQLEMLGKRQRTKAAEMFREFWEEQAKSQAQLKQTYVLPPPRTDEERVQMEQLQKYWDQHSPETRWSIYNLHNEIIVDKLRPGQVLDLQLVIAKGIGKDHAKWSPVSPATYRLHPEIIITEPIRGEDAEKFQKCFPKGVIGLKSVKVGGKSVKEAYVKNARGDTVSRECLRHPEFKDKVILTRIRDHFIFSVESVGQYDSPADIFIESCKVLMSKCKGLKDELEKIEENRKISGGLGSQ